MQLLILQYPRGPNFRDELNFIRNNVLLITRHVYLIRYLISHALGKVLLCASTTFLRPAAEIA